MKIVLVMMLLVFGPQAQLQVDKVYDRLSRVDVFAFGGIGFAGVTSSGETDYKTMMGRSSAMTDFERVFAASNAQGKCYALVGIHKLNPQRFKELARPLRDSKKLVVMMHGCIMSRESLGDVVKNIEEGKYPG